MSTVSRESAGALARNVPAAGFNDHKEFQKIVEAYRGELLTHCYRFAGSLHDAEDLVQETFLKAWRGIARFEGRSSLRSWLYRIATNVCLDAAARKSRARRVFPADVSKPTTRMPDGKQDSETFWIEPWPDLANVADPSTGPAARYELRETVRLAFISATQRLPARQRAVLLLRDVLGWSANETADALKMTVASANSALQRARGTLEKDLPAEEINDEAAGEGQRSIADDYADAWERADLGGLVALLAKDASMEMPPFKQWYSGRAAIRSFFGWAFDWAWKQGKRGAFRMIEIRSNGQVAFGTYLRRRGHAKHHAHTIQILTFRNGRIGRLTLFVGPQFFPDFGLPVELDPA